jgi:hypothetical protein
MDVGRRVWVWGVAVAIAAGAVALVAVGSWPQPRRTVPPARARVYSATHVCLLTGPTGLADPATAPVWAGIEDASEKTRAQASYLSVAGPDTAANAAPYLATLAGGRCDPVVVVGAAPVGAVGLDAVKFPRVHFLVVGGESARGNVSDVPSGDAAATRAAVAAAVTNR